MIDISVTDLVKSFDLEKKILDGISFQVDTGERVGLLGKNGAGKPRYSTSSPETWIMTPARCSSPRAAGWA